MEAFILEIIFSFESIVIFFLLHLMHEGRKGRKSGINQFRKPPSGREGDHEVGEGACVYLKVMFATPLFANQNQ